MHTNKLSPDPRASTGTNRSDTSRHGAKTKAETRRTTKETLADPAKLPERTRFFDPDATPLSASQTRVDESTSRFSLQREELASSTKRKRRHAETGLADEVGPRKKRKPASALPAKLYVEVDTTSGRAVLLIDARRFDKNRRSQAQLAEFLQKSGYASASPEAVWEALVEATPSGNKAFVRLDTLRGIARDEALDLPRLGQSHELEFSELRTEPKSKGSTVSHNVTLAESTTEFNGKPALKMVTETLGKERPTATTEFVSGPYGERADLDKLLDTVGSIVSERRANASGGPIDLEEVAKSSRDDPSKIPLEPSARELQLGYRDGKTRTPEKKNRPVVQTTIDIPIRSSSKTLVETENGLSDPARKLVRDSIKATDAFVRTVGLETRQGKKLWETLNQFVWMAAAEAIVHTARNDPSLSSNDEAADWARYEGKNFYGLLPRFSPGDLLRTGGLKAVDRDKILETFASEPNIRALAAGASSVIAKLAAACTKAKDGEYRAIGDVLSRRRGELAQRLELAVENQLVPGGNEARYPETSRAYGTEVRRYDASGDQTPSLTLAGGQYLPGRKHIPADMELERREQPVTGAYEARRGTFPANEKLQEYFDTETHDETRARKPDEILERLHETSRPDEAGAVSVSPGGAEVRSEDIELHPESK